MCGIFALFSAYPIANIPKVKKYALKMSSKLRHRGPDGTGYYQTEHSCFTHERLSIIDPDGGNQPLKNKDSTVILCINGEIFNYKELRVQYPEYLYQTKSDCESILALYEHYYNETAESRLTHSQIVAILGQLDGQFSFVLHDTRCGMVLVVRDPYGITQLYYGINKYGNVQVASEMKALENCIRVEVMPSGAYMYFDARHPIITPIQYFSETPGGSWLNCNIVGNRDQFYYEPSRLLSLEEQEPLLVKIRETLERAVEKRLMSDVPFGMCLSGGLDSSLVASITMRIMRANPEKYGINPVLHTFSIGIKDESSDLVYAREVAKYIGSVHHEIYFTYEDAINAMENVIYHIESADITSVRASICNYLLARKIQSYGIKMVLSGEGSDEVLGGYLYFHQAPNDEAHQMECKMRVMQLGYFDCLRTDKTLLGNSIEGRYPFLDLDFVKLCINLHKDVKCQKGIEKYIIRKAFDLIDPYGRQLYLPKNVLYRQKCQFSNCGTNHCDTIKTFSERNVDERHSIAFENSALIFPINTPPTKEAFYYRLIFESFYPNRGNVYKYWIPNTKWENVSADPSGLCQISYKDNEQYDEH